MATSQFTPPILIAEIGSARTLDPISLQSSGRDSGYDETWLRDLLLEHPKAIPVAEIDASFGPLVPVCKELDTRRAGPADALYLNHLGLPTLVECKLWRNPEARREVVGQILDYARVLRNWTYADLQREAARARGQPGFDLFAHVRQTHPDLAEAPFVDGVTRSLSQGRMLLLVMGDGIREGVSAITEYIADHAGLHFTFGLVECPVFDLGDGRRIVQPRVVAKTLIVNRTVVELVSPGMRVVDAAAKETSQLASQDDERDAWMRAFWAELLAGLKLDDSNQPMPRPTAQSQITFSLPVSGGNMWLTAYFSEKEKRIGVTLGLSKTIPLAMRIGDRLMEDHEAIDREINLPTTWRRTTEGKAQVSSTMSCATLRDVANRENQMRWFNTHINAYVNALRPRIAQFAEELLEVRST